MDVLLYYRLRFLRYDAGQYFKPHFDGSYVREDGREKSFITIHLYLNEVNLSFDLSYFIHFLLFKAFLLG